MAKRKNKCIEGKVTVDKRHVAHYSVETTAVNDTKELYGIDMIAEIEGALRQELTRDVKNVRNLTVIAPSVKKAKNARKSKKSKK
jgi:hypothetical protein